VGGSGGRLHRVAGWLVDCLGCMSDDEATEEKAAVSLAVEATVRVAGTDRAMAITLNSALTIAEMHQTVGDTLGFRPGAFQMTCDVDHTMREAPSSPSKNVELQQYTACGQLPGFAAAVKGEGSLKFNVWLPEHAMTTQGEMRIYALGDKSPKWPAMKAEMQAARAGPTKPASQAKAQAPAASSAPAESPAKSE